MAIRKSSSGDNRTLQFILISLTIWYGYLWMTGNLVQAPEEVVEIAEDGAPAVEAPAPTPVPVQPLIPAAPVASRDVPFEGCGASGSWATGTASLGNIILPDRKAAFVPQPVYYEVFDWVGGESLSEWLPFGPDPGPVEIMTDFASALAAGVGPIDQQPPPAEVTQNGQGSLGFRGVGDGAIEITKNVRVSQEEPCVFDVDVTWLNRGSSSYAAGMWVSIHDLMPVYLNRFQPVRRPWSMVDGGTQEFSEPEELEQAELVGRNVSWFGIADNYFAFLLVPESGEEAELWHSSYLIPDADVPEPDELVALNHIYGHHYRVLDTLGPGEAHTERFQLFIGPKELDLLNRIDGDLGEVVDLGWFAFFAKLLLSLLRFFYSLLGSWGWAIIALTLAVKALFFPLTQMSFKSQQAMQAIQPELNALRETHKDQPEEMNRQMMKLFQDNGVNPLGGCLPMVVQMPVWFALYSVLLTSVEIYHSEFFYLRDLSAVDPYGALPAIVVILMVVQQRFVPTGNMDPTQARMMKMMPLIFGFFFFTFPSGLVLYIFCNMLLSIMQQWYIKRTFKAATPA
jgi:YidC/Oxa1 family membrane protein insertase